MLFHLKHYLSSNLISHSRVNHLRLGAIPTNTEKPLWGATHTHSRSEPNENRTKRTKNTDQLRDVDAISRVSGNLTSKTNKLRQKHKLKPRRGADTNSNDALREPLGQTDSSIHTFFTYIFFFCAFNLPSDHAIKPTAATKISAPGFLLALKHTTRIHWYKVTMILFS